MRPRLRLRPRARAQERAANGAGRRVELVLITGHSGAGKSQAMACFEDAGYFCVDNLPPGMIASITELFSHEGSKVEKAAVVCDARGGDYFEDLVRVLDELDPAIALRILFLDAEEQTLLNRYTETRRRHPLAPEGTVAEGIQAERIRLEALRERADIVIDTTGLTDAMLRRKIASEMLPAGRSGRLAVTLMTFGFKHGPAREADMLFDVRFLPNPHYESGLRDQTGLDPEVRDFVFASEGIDPFFEHLLPLLDYLLPAYEREGKSHLTVAFGCTGGKHRSVAIAEALAQRYRERGHMVELLHRDLDKTS